MKTNITLLAVIFWSVLLQTSSAQIPTLFNTGVSTNNPDGSPATLTADGAGDQHYSIVAGIDGALSPFVTKTGVYPFPNWAADTSASKWISPQATYAGFLQDPPGTYTYRTTFDLTGFNLYKVSISGSLSADNAITAVRINGVTVTYSQVSLNLSAFSLPMGDFVNGINTLEFDVLNYPPDGGNPSGFRAQLSGTMVSSSAALVLNTNPSNSGTVMGSGTYQVGSQVQISATAVQNWTFTGWNDGVTTNPRTVTVPFGGATYTAHFNQIYALSYGITDTATNPTIYGDTAATTVSQAIGHLPGVMVNKLDTELAHDNASDSLNIQALQNDIAAIGQQVQPGSTFIFYINAHGTYDPTSTGAGPGSESPIYRQTENHNGIPVTSTTATTGPTLLAFSGAANNVNTVLSSGSFAALFSGSNWQNVNKLFVIDTCYAGGFWQGAGGINYLAALPHSAIIAAAPENLISWWWANAPGIQYEGGSLGYAFSTVLPQMSSNFSYDDLVTQVIQQEMVQYNNQTYVGTDQFVAGINAFVEGGAEDGWGVPLVAAPSVSVTNAMSRACHALFCRKSCTM